LGFILPATITNNPSTKLRPHILAAGNEILHNLNLRQRVLDDIFNGKGWFCE
jgi:hypothetical protein